VDTDTSAEAGVVYVVTAAGKAVTLPDPTKNANRTISVKNLSTGDVTVMCLTDGSGDGGIDGDSILSLGQKGYIVAKSDGTTWVVVSKG
jgi:hypothetical protein